MSTTRYFETTTNTETNQIEGWLASGPIGVRQAVPKPSGGGVFKIIEDDLAYVLSALAPPNRLGWTAAERCVELEGLSEEGQALFPDEE
jgi:hypothetical protein